MKKFNKGITLISLVVTIIVLIILARISIGLVLGENGIIRRINVAIQENLIAQYKEQIDLTKAEVKIYKIEESFDLEILKQALDRNSNKRWVNSTEIINDDGIEKIKLVTNDALVFYITEKTTEYKGKSTEVITISTSPSSKTDDAVSSITVRVTINNTDRITSSVGYYAWSQSSSATIENWNPLILSNSGAIQRTGEITSSQEIEGDYYLYIKAIINGKEKIQHFGEYKFQAKPTVDNLICESVSKSADETTLTLKVGSNKVFTGWTVTYKINNGTETEITAGTTISNVIVTKGDIVTVKYSKDGENAVTKTLNADDYNLTLTAEMIKYTATWDGTSITNVEQALKYLKSKLNN